MASVYPRRDRKISEFTLNIYQNEYSNTLYNTLYLTLLKRVCNFLWAARSRLIDVGGDSVTK